jgi:hypothetical protein
VNMGDVLAGSPDLQVSESGKAAISSQEITKPDVSTPKVERHGLMNRPDVRADKSSHSSLNNRLGVQGDKSGIVIEDRPGVTSNKLGKESREIQK